VQEVDRLEAEQGAAAGWSEDAQQQEQGTSLGRHRKCWQAIPEASEEDKLQGWPMTMHSYVLISVVFCISSMFVAH
jgi:hypothetical protein